MNALAAHKMTQQAKHLTRSHVCSTLAIPVALPSKKSLPMPTKNAFRFPRSWMPGTHDFSFSGIKTSVLHLVTDLQNRAKKVWINTYGVQNIKNFDPKTVKLPVADIAASFQESVVDVLVTKTIKAAEEYGCKEILIAGGVSANKALRETMTERFSGQSACTSALLMHRQRCDDCYSGLSSLPQRTNRQLRFRRTSHMEHCKFAKINYVYSIKKNSL